MAKTIVELNPDRCVCCYACVAACRDLHCDVDEDGPALRRAVRQEDENGTIRCGSLGCMHCADAPCLAACSAGAIRRDGETGLVVVEEARCVGCRRCQKACPYGVPQFKENWRMVKCDACIDRLKQGLEPLCVKTCPSGALYLREPDDPSPSAPLLRQLFGKR